MKGIDRNRPFLITNSLKMITKLKWTIGTGRCVSFFFFFKVVIHFVKEKDWKGGDVVKGYLKDEFSVGRGWIHLLWRSSHNEGAVSKTATLHPFEFESQFYSGDPFA